MKLTTKIRIFPTIEQKWMLWQISKGCRKMYNYCWMEYNHYYQNVRFLDSFFSPIFNFDYTLEYKRTLSFYDLNHKLPSFRNKLISTKRILERVLSMTIKEFIATYTRFYEERKKWNLNPQFKEINDKLIPLNKPQPTKPKKKWIFMALHYNRSGFKIIDNIIKFSHKHPSKINLSFNVKKSLIPKGKIKQITISRDRKKRFFISIISEEDVPKFQDNGLYQAFDLGINDLVYGINIYGKPIKIHNILQTNWYKKTKKRKREIDQMISRCRGNKRFEKKSRRWKKLNQLEKRIKNKESNKLINFQHRISSILLKNTKANTIIVGDLNVKEMAKKKKGTGKAYKTKANKTLNYSIHNTGSIGRFVSMLEYKAEKLGKKIIKIDERNTSKQCCICGRIKKMLLSERIYECECGNKIPRDLNSAFNIMKRFLEFKQQGKYEFLSRTTSLVEVNFTNNYKTLVKEAINLVNSDH